MSDRAPRLRGVRVIDGTWPVVLPPERVPWPAPIYLALGRASLLEPARLQRLTFGELLELPAVGVRGALEVAALAEAVVAATAELVLDDATCRELRSAAAQLWARRVRADDPRLGALLGGCRGWLSEVFQDALGDAGGSRARAIGDSLALIRARAREIDAEPIDTALVALLRSRGVSERDVTVMSARLGWPAGEARTLREVADRFSITRERVRQIVSRTLGRLGYGCLPQVQRAVRLIADAAAIAGDEAARLLVERLSTVPCDPAVLKALAERAGYEVTFRIAHEQGTSCVLP